VNETPGDVARLGDFRRRWRERDARAPSEPWSPTRDAAPPPDARERGGRMARAKPVPGRAPGRHPAAVEHAGGDGAALRRLAAPRPVAVQAAQGGVPTQVGRMPVEALLEDWVVEDRWWTGRPVRRRYFELVLVDGRNVVVFRDLVGGRWFAQRA
jgi:hypothetical protein